MSAWTDVFPVLRISGECYPSNVYFKNLDWGTLWLGTGMKYMSALQPFLPPIEVISDLSDSNTTLPAIQTAKDGRVDVPLRLC